MADPAAAAAVPAAPAAAQGGRGADPLIEWSRIWVARKKNITRQKNRIDEELGKPHPIPNLKKWLEGRIKVLEECQKDLKEAHDVVISNPGINNAEAEALSETYGEYLDRAEEGLALANAKLAEMQREATTAADTANVSTFAEAIQRTNTKLPQLTIRAFDGTQSDWARFIEQFRTQIDRRADLDQVSKMDYLRSFLEKEALKKVEGFPYTADGYTAALEALRNHYGHRRRTVESLIQDVTNRPQAKGMKELGPLIDFLSSRHRLLESQGAIFKGQGVHAILLSMFVAKLPQEARMKWEQEVNNKEIQENVDVEVVTMTLGLKEFFSFMDVIVRSTTTSYGGGNKDKEGDNKPKEKNGGNNGGNKGNNSSGQQNTTLTANFGPRKESGPGFKGKDKGAEGGKGAAGTGSKSSKPASTKAGCLFCGGSHATGSCKKAEDMSMRDRWNKIRGKCCYRCLELKTEEHMGNTCPQGTCPVEGCHRYHHQLLHNDD
jgi:hypothetical protein